ncbi:phospholipid scramblase 2-like isoform X1 [Lissotriton helveticus]
MDTVLIHQETAVEGEASKYKIKNKYGKQLYFAIQQNGFNVTDNAGKDVMKLHIKTGCFCFCIPCSLNKMDIQSPPGTIIGCVVQNWKPCGHKYTILDEAGEKIMIISRLSSGAAIFEVNSFDMLVEIGKIQRRRSVVREAKLEIQFPLDLHESRKRLLIGASIFISTMYYEHRINTPVYTGSGDWVGGWGDGGYSGGYDGGCDWGDGGCDGGGGGCDGGGDGGGD